MKVTTGNRIVIFLLMSAFFLSIGTSFLWLGEHRMSDRSLESNYIDAFAQHFKRGRANIAADYNLDGKIDFFIGNPGDESMILENVTPDNGRESFVVAQVLLTGDLAWGAVSFDYDNDGDYDLFITCGANEGRGFDYLFRNNWILNGDTTGVLNFSDVSESAGIKGPVPVGETEPIPTPSANAVVGDYDQDGDNDIFVSTNILGLNNFSDCGNFDILFEGTNRNFYSKNDQTELIGRNTLWRNNSDGTFTDVTVEAGLSDSLKPTRHSTFIDFDNDGDVDLFENNHGDYNILWKNNGNGTFTNVTFEMSLPGEDLRYPSPSFVSGACDFNNDGWEDIIAFSRGSSDPGSPYNPGHAIFINQNGTGFKNVAEQTGINDIYTSIGRNGVMGCQVGDINGDGIPDVYIGNGGPPTGVADNLYLSQPILSVEKTPIYDNKSELIDFPADIPPNLDEPPYPYRTHGTTFVDIDNDGKLEICVVNGGPASGDDFVREPNRLFKFGNTVSYNFIKIQAIGDGINISRDAIGTRFELKVSEDGNNQRRIFKTLFAGSCFSAQNGFVMHFAIGNSNVIEGLIVHWPDGSISTINENLEINSFNKIYYNVFGIKLEKNIHPDSVNTLTDYSGTYHLLQNYPNPFNPETNIFFNLPRDGYVVLKIFDLTGREVKTLINEYKSAGQYNIKWDASDKVSGIYFYKLTSGNFSSVKKMILLR
ncbi:MAG: hypothetical protein Kow0098_15780 [Ignavibacteriaceae bacterium]